MAINKVYAKSMDIVRQIYISERYNRIMLWVKEEDSDDLISVSYEDGTDFEEKIVDLFIDVLTYRLRVSKRVQPFLNALVSSESAWSKRTMELLNTALGFDKPFSVFVEPQEVERRAKAMNTLRVRLYNAYRKHADDIDGIRMHKTI